jgi:hypothetical protein
LGESGWKYPTVTGRASYRPNPMWDLGLSASAGTYLRESAAPTVAPGHGLGDYRQTVVGGDVAFAWHHFQLWAELMAARFAIPDVGPADAVACYVEAKYKLTPQLAGAVRWGRQWYGTVDDPDSGPVRWGRNAWRLDFAATWRHSYNAQTKVQYTVHHEELAADSLAGLLAAQFTLSF